MVAFPFRRNKSNQADDGENHHDQKRYGCPTEVLTKRGNTQQQTKEDQNQHSTGYIKVLQRLFPGNLIAGSKETGYKNSGTDGNTHPQHGAPSVSGNHKCANGWPDNYGCAGKKHIQGKSFRDLVLRKFRSDIGKDHRPHCSRADTYDKTGKEHKHKGVCQSGQHISQGEYSNTQQQCLSASDHITDFAENGGTGGGGHGLRKRCPSGVVIVNANVLYKGRSENRRKTPYQTNQKSGQCIGNKPKFICHYFTSFCNSMSRLLCIICFRLDTLFTGGIEYEAEIFNLPTLRQYRCCDSG